MSQLSKSFVDNIRLIITQAQSKAIRAVNQERVLMYWHIGKHIVEEEQNGKQYADYGAKILQSLANELEKDFGSGFSVRQLELCRQFYNTFPNTNALRSQLNWTQYRLLLRIEDKDKRTYYIEEFCNYKIFTLEQFKDKHFGKPGTPKRDKLEVGYTNFKKQHLSLSNGFQ